MLFPLHLPHDPWTSLPFPTGSSKLNETPVASGAQQPALYIPYGKSKTIPDPTVLQLHVPPPQISSVRMVAAVQRKPDLLLLKLFVIGAAVVFLSQRAEKKETWRRNLTWSAPPPPNLCPLSVTLQRPSINVDSGWSCTAGNPRPTHKPDQQSISNVTGTEERNKIIYKQSNFKEIPARGTFDQLLTNLNCQL